MNEEDLKKILYLVKDGRINIDDALEQIKTLPFESIGFATLDHHRTLRQGFPEVIWGESKTVSQIIDIMEKMAEQRENILVTRVDDEKAEKILKRFPEAKFNALARTVSWEIKSIKITGKGIILIITAGTSDIPVAEEAKVTAKIMGNRVDSLYDVGIAGIHRLFGQREKIFKAGVLIVVAGMEGALPSVVSGLVARPVIAVPTSIGYGTSFGGITALLGMLNSCSSGISVVNIDNGFGAGYVASLINRV
ncbi:MAG: nickel pincer cofactor biosynthesis protein LarB [Thermodesulfobacteriota bacterium]|nr:nickel pincer cofactor biosynthesis protein LarB [Thermodesulfobacteriota bacterium]